jgi:SPP1 gp7 family putative phage head morphogenesis protein
MAKAKLMPDNIYQMGFWEDDEQEMWDDIAPLLLEVYFNGIDGGVDALPPDVRILADFDRVNTDALEFARQYRYELIKGITDTTRKQTQKAISDWISSGAPLDALEAVLDKTFGPVRARMIAQTETTRVYAVANQAAFESTGLVDQMEIRNAADDRVCPICVPKGGTRIEIGAVINLPPFHIGCRCWVQPVVSEKALTKKLDEILV